MGVFDMAVLKVIEIMAGSSKGWEDATARAVAKASKSLKGIRSVWVQDQSATVGKNGKIKEYRVTCRISFEVGG
jgi:flavin-binding protein dodecin